MTPITQDQYLEMLAADNRRTEELFIRDAKEPEGQQWRCRTHGEPAKAKIIAHPIWDGPFDDAGSGRCDYRTLPVCPRCSGDQPTWENGAPIRIPMMPGKSTPVLTHLVDRLFHVGLPPEFTGRASN